MAPLRKQPFAAFASPFAFVLKRVQYVEPLAFQIRIFEFSIQPRPKCRQGRRGHSRLRGPDRQARDLPIEVAVDLDELSNAQRRYRQGDAQNECRKRQPESRVHQEPRHGDNRRNRGHRCQVEAESFEAAFNPPETQNQARQGDQDNPFGDFPDVAARIDRLQSIGMHFDAAHGPPRNRKRRHPVVARCLGGHPDQNDPIPEQARVDATGKNFPCRHLLKGAAIPDEANPKLFGLNTHRAAEIFVVRGGKHTGNVEDFHRKRAKDPALGILRGDDPAHHRIQIRVGVNVAQCDVVLAKFFEGEAPYQIRPGSFVDPGREYQVARTPQNIGQVPIFFRRPGIVQQDVDAQDRGLSGIHAFDQIGQNGSRPRQGAHPIKALFVDPHDQHAAGGRPLTRQTLCEVVRDVVDLLKEALPGQQDKDCGGGNTERHRLENVKGHEISVWPDYR